VNFVPARTLAPVGTAGAGALAGAAAYVVVGGLPGMLYAAGISLASVVGATAIRSGRTMNVLDLVAVPLPAGWRHEPGERAFPRAVVDAVSATHPEALASDSELEEHRMALANLGAQLARESEAARRDMQRLEKRIRELETERDGLLELLGEERARFEHTLEVLCDGIGTELAELEPAVEAIVDQSHDEVDEPALDGIIEPVLEPQLEALVEH